MFALNIKSSTTRSRFGNRSFFRPLLAPLILTLIGLIFCLLNLQGLATTICHTAGCTLYQDFKILGLSLWWYGLGFFSLLTFIALLGQNNLGFKLITLGLLADCFLLLLLSLTSACLNCMLVALILGLTFLAFRFSLKKEALRLRSRIVFYLWLSLFLATSLNLAHQEIKTWALVKSEEPSVLLFFSPSCPSCQEALAFYSGHVGASFYPVLDREDDWLKVLKMHKALKDGQNLKEALALASDPNALEANLSLSESLKIRLGLLLNKAHVLASGSQGLPYLEYRGLPSFIAKELKRRAKAGLEESFKAPKEESKELDFTLPLDPLTQGQCQKDTCQ